MKPVAPREYEGPDLVVLRGPAGSDIAELPAIRTEAGFLSEWDLSFEERQAILDGARVRMHIVGAGHPPVAMWVEGVEDTDG